MGDPMLDRLANQVVASPFDLDTVSRFFGEFEKKSSPEIESYQIYLALKYFHAPDKFPHLNRLGDIYLQEKKYFLALLCFIESLRRNPNQPDTFEKFERYESRLTPPALHAPGNRDESVSVIMCTYNRNGEIAESIESVMNQTYGNYELVLVNDGGTDEVENVLSAFDREKITYVRLTENKGHAAVLNEGIRRSKGKYIAYLDDDDVYYPNHLELLVQALKENRRNIAYSNTKMVCGTMEGGRFLAGCTKGHWRVPFDRDRLIQDNFLSNLCIVHEREVLLDIGLFYEDLRVVMDWEMWLRASLKHTFLHVDGYTGEYRFRESNVTSSRRLWIDFYTELIRNYYSCYRGLVSRVKHLLGSRRPDDAKPLFLRLKEEYEDYFKSPLMYREVLALSRLVHDKPFREKVTKDYFRTHTRSFMRYVQETKSVGLLRLVSPLMPGKAKDVLRGRFRRVLPR